ncbi:DUF2848 domain-containing protein [Deferribacter autotrophicus]|uniref:DUF2848 domain-containing protein n=1 Tax=Deferribacter autotrophicus TaxID=500465 RepID=A0A5A8F129_9BACT|nr:DUF2848 family protein [Deferribacter autotrophicus]KAA0256989.1 DUF2848 domain-containing protein [Deferribacter autotrophicus]
MLKAKVVNRDNVTAEINLDWEFAVALGYTGRDQESVNRHIEELKKLNVPIPQSIPAVYWFDPERISTTDTLYVIGDKTSGEIEFFAAFNASDELFITVASDHTDRELESISVSKSKQICTKIISNIFWRYDDIKNHFDEIILQCFVKFEDSEEYILYQEGKLNNILQINELIKYIKSDYFYNNEKFCFFSGTIPILSSETLFAKKYKLLMIDPVLKREITHTYKVIALPDRL